MINSDLLRSEAERIGITLSENEVKRFEQYADRLLDRNKHVNLTAITDGDEIVIKHFLDCLYILKYVQMSPGQSLIDVGSGAGFPGFPLLIVNPDLEVSFVDSIMKKVSFIKDALQSTGLIGSVYQARAEELGRDNDFRERFDYATARAVAPLNILCEYCLPLVKKDGFFIAMKGAGGNEEAESAENAIEILGGKLEKLAEFTLPTGDKRCIIIIKKISQTPTKYPRKSKKIDTKPL